MIRKISPGQLLWKNCSSAWKTFQPMRDGRHEEQFEDHIIRKARHAAMRLPLEGQLSKVRDGRGGSAKLNLPDPIKKGLDEIWDNEIVPMTGLKTYDDLRELLKL